MAGGLTISTLNDSSGVLATQNGMKGVLKAWCYFNAATPAIINSFNISSITRTATGVFTFGFTTAMPNTNYVSVGSSADTHNYAQAVGNSSAAGARTTSAVGIITYRTDNGTALNPPMCFFMVAGD